MAIESLDTREQLAVVADGDQDLSVASDSGLQDGQWAAVELVLL